MGRGKGTKKFSKLSCKKYFVKNFTGLLPQEEWVWLSFPITKSKDTLQRQTKLGNHLWLDAKFMAREEANESLVRFKKEAIKNATRKPTLAIPQAKQNAKQLARQAARNRSKKALPKENSPIAKEPTPATTPENPRLPSSIWKNILDMAMDNTYPFLDTAWRLVSKEWLAYSVELIAARRSLLETSDPSMGARIGCVLYATEGIHFRHIEIKIDDERSMLMAVDVHEELVLFTTTGFDPHNDNLPSVGYPLFERAMAFVTPEGSPEGLSPAFTFPYDVFYGGKGPSPFAGYFHTMFMMDAQSYCFHMGNDVVGSPFWSGLLGDKLNLLGGSSTISRNELLANARKDVFFSLLFKD